ncbi:hypothetical protein A28LD_2265 [Idiomarina sp. A28L]|uniref:hypothetical protein n=1 Tax=Idiomarina sp. A28L TaxID=1036674 RepID=UPI0002138D8B|nr:hypothetical protein [Idiomarina sp. A28L]EGN74238.1 hypothetical protein A28LD_2265 [Idiomarina sp. A28L]
MFFSKKHWARWFRRPFLVGGIYCNSSSFALAIINQQQSACQVVFAQYSTFDPALVEANVAVKAKLDIPNGIKHVSFHVVSDTFQVLPLLLPAEINNMETVACAELKVKQQPKSEDWLWDVELDGQNSKLWLLAKAQHTNLVKQLQCFGIVEKQLCSWQPAAKAQPLHPQAERLLKDCEQKLFAVSNQQPLATPEINKSELVLAISAALFKKGGFGG